MRTIPTVCAVLLQGLVIFGQGLTISAGQALFNYDAADTQNVNSGFTFASLDYDHTWPLQNGSFSLFTEGGFLRENTDGSAGLGYNAGLRGRGSFYVFGETGLALSAGYGLSTYPHYDNSGDTRVLNLDVSGATAMDALSSLNYGAGFTCLEYPNLNEYSGNLYRLYGNIGRSFESGRSVRLQMEGGLKEYADASSSLRLESRLQVGQSLGEGSGLSVYGEGSLGSNELEGKATAFPSGNDIVDPYTYDALGAGVAVKTLGTGSRFAVNYGLEQRKFHAMQRTDILHSAGLEWRLYLNRAAGNNPIRLSVEPSVRLTQSTVAGEDSMAAYFMVSVAR
ncbi:MAG: hypothetical protein V1913_02360 [Fibrobacterota bacterium]